MTTSFSDYDFAAQCADANAYANFVAQQNARNTIQLKIREWTLMLCDTLKQHYIDHSIKLHSISIAAVGDPHNYHQGRIDALNNGECDYDFIIESDDKFHKIVEVDDLNQRSVHALVDKKTGEVYKAASVVSDNSVRFDLRLIQDREWLFENADWAGFYLISHKR